MKLIDGKELKKMISVGEDRLKNNAEAINALNVFPVPDGDTGTNMSLSMTSGLTYVKDNNHDEAGKIAADLAKGLLMGARGNSGVILSQLFRGFAKGLEGLEAINAKNLASAFQHGVETAYKAVMKPVEGTILTVSREAAKAGVEKAEVSDDVIEVMTAIQQAAEVALKHTPEQLPVLKEVGVVDSGGQGLVTIYTGFLEALKGESIALELESANDNKLKVDFLSEEDSPHEVDHDIAREDIKFGYCTEIIVRLGDKERPENFDPDAARSFFDGLGDSIVMAYDDELFKVHVHTETPGEVMNYGQRFGSLIKIKVENMREQHEAVLSKQKAGEKEATIEAQSAAKAKKLHQKNAVVAVVAGAGLEQMFKDLGVSTIISGGQTMNPSTEDIVKAIEALDAENILILPNNKNIQMAATQAAELVEMPACVIPTKTISQGLAAMLSFNLDASLEENEAVMTEEISNVKSGQITKATRDTTIEGVSIHEQDYMGIVEGNIVTANTHLETTCLETLKAMLDTESELITLIYGEGISEQDAQNMAEKIESAYPDYDLEVYQGDQPVYQYFISVE